MSHHQNENSPIAESAVSATAPTDGAPSTDLTDLAHHLPSKKKPASKSAVESPADTQAAVKARIKTDADADADAEGKSYWERSLFKSGVVKARAVLEWVADNLCIRPLEPADAPGATAWGLLQWSRESASNRSAFYQMWAKLLPTRAQTDEQDATDDADTDLLSDMEFIHNAKRAAALQAGAERHSGEHPISDAVGEDDQPK
jgi:hypothetical protein